MTAPTALPPEADALCDSLACSPTGTIATREASGRASSSVKYVRMAPLHIASTTSFTVVSDALPTALIRSMGQSSAAKRRAPVIFLLMIVRGAYSETAEVSLRTPRDSVFTRAAGSPAASALIGERAAQHARREPEDALVGAFTVALRLAGVAGRPHRRHADLVGVRGQHLLHQPHRGDAVDESVVHLAVHRHPAVAEPLDEVHLPQRPLQGEPGAVQAPAELEQLTDAAGLGQRAVTEVVLEVELVVLLPEPLATRGQRAVRPLEEQRRRLVVAEHLVVEVLDEVPAGPLGLAEQLQPADVHRLRPALGEEEARRGRVHRCRHRGPFAKVAGWCRASSRQQATFPHRPGSSIGQARGCCLVRCSSQSESVRISA